MLVELVEIGGGNMIVAILILAPFLFVVMCVMRLGSIESRREEL